MSEKLDAKPVSGILVPVAIVLGGALIVWAIVGMLNAETGYKKLVKEMHSKTFGNRWVAAYELSKYISANQIPEEDIPWLINQLEGLYGTARDPRTRNFLVLTVGALQHDSKINLLNKALDDDDKNVLFSAVMGIGNLNFSDGINLEKVSSFLEGQDQGLTQVAILALLQHSFEQSLSKLKVLQSSTNQTLKYIAASAVYAFGDRSAWPQVKEVFSLKPSENFNQEQLQSLMLNTLTALQKSREKDVELLRFLEFLSNSDLGLSVKTKAEQVLIELKKP